MLRGNRPCFLPFSDDSLLACDEPEPGCDGCLVTSADGTVGKEGGDVGLLDMLAKLLSRESDMFLGSLARLAWLAAGGVDVNLVRGCMDCKCATRLGASSCGGKLLSIEGNKFV